MALIKLENVSKFYKSGEGVSVGMQKVSLSFNAGEFVAVTGESGSGKSTLLNVISGLDTYEDGELYINGEETSHFTIKNWEAYRAKYIGFIFQSYNIIDSYTVYQNVMLALEIQNYPKKDRKKRALELIDKVGLTSHKNHKAAKLSGGQKQRAVIARALAKDCPIIACDEPTGNLDSESSKQVIDLLHEISKEKLVIIVTHDFDEVKKYATRKIKIHDGEVVEDKVLQKDVETYEVTEPETKSMAILSVARFALRNIFSIPRRFLLFLFLQLAIMMIFTNIYSNFMKTAEEFVLVDISYAQNYINGVKTNQFSDNRFAIFKQDNTAMTMAEFNELNGLNGNYFLYKDAFFVDYYTNIEVIDTNGNGQSAKFDTSYTIRNKENFLIEGKINPGSNEVVLSNAFRYVNIGDKIQLNVGNWIIENNSRTYTNLTSNIVTFQTQKNTTTYLQLEAETINFGYHYKSIQIVNNQVDLSTVGINYQDVTYLKLSENLAGTIKEVTVVGKYNDNFAGTVYLSHEELNVTTIGNALLIAASSDSEARRIFNQIDTNKYRVIFPAQEEGQLASINNPIKLIVKIALYFIAFFIGIFLYFLLATVMKNIMSSRMKDFAIYRSIGANQQKIALLVIFEQMFLMIASFILTSILIFILTRIDYSTSVNFSYLTFIDFIVLFLTFAVLTFRLATKFNNKTFKISVIENISESKEAGL